MPAYSFKFASDSDRELWDGYVQSHSDASHYHLFGWRDVIHETYGHRTFYLMLMACDEGVDASRAEERHAATILGVLPLVHLKNIIFGNDLVSLPFLDSGGILANDLDAEKILLAEAIRLGREVGAGGLELRHERLLASCADINALDIDDSRELLKLTTKTNKVRMLLNLPESVDVLMKSFTTKLRNHIRKPLKEGFVCKSGGVELVEDFYKVFVVNMRQLGSPVHSIKLMQRVAGEFAKCCTIFVVYKNEEPVAAAFVLGYDSILRNPWASSLRKYASLRPNTLLYMSMFEFACDNGYRVFDFGRSTPGEGTYKFKEQWGAVPAPLNWHHISLDGKSRDPENSGTEKFEMAARYWSKLPLLVTKVLGPRIRKHIGL